MNVAVARTPKILLRQSAPIVPNKLPNPSCLELVLTELGKGHSMDRRQMFRRQCMRPETLTKVTIWELYQLSLRLQREGANYNRLKLEEIRRLMSLAPKSVKRLLAMSESI